VFQFEVGYCRRRRFEVEDLLWENQLNLEDYKLYAAFYGGPIALLRDNKRIVRVTSGPGASQKPFIYLFTPAGREIGSIKVQDINAYHFFFSKETHVRPTTTTSRLLLQWSSGPIVEIGWSDVEELVVVQDDGHVLIYDYFGNYQRTFSMGSVRHKSAA
jgi:hypothetical protein